MGVLNKMALYLWRMIGYAFLRVYLLIFQNFRLFRHRYFIITANLKRSGHRCIFNSDSAASCAIYGAWGEALAVKYIPVPWHLYHLNYYICVFFNILSTSASVRWRHLPRGRLPKVSPPSETLLSPITLKPTEAHIFLTWRFLPSWIVMESTALFLP